MASGPSAIQIESGFPYSTVAILALCQGVNGYTRTSLFPYVGFMVKHLLSLTTTNEVGYYAGFVASAFTLGRLLTGYSWGHATDVIGRKPVLAGGLIMIAVFSVAFGFSQTFSWAIGSRLLLGLLTAVIPAVRTMTHEICGPEHVIQGMAYLGGFNGLGIVLGSIVGGLLSQPADYYPTVFSPSGVFARYPYLIPNLFGACWALLLLPFVILHLPETMKPHTIPDEQEPISKKDEGNISDGLTVTTDGNNGGHVDASGSTDEGRYEEVDHDEPIQQNSERRDPGVCGPGGLLATPHVKTFLVLGFVLQMVMIGFQEVYPLWTLSSYDAGGLEWNTIQIGKVAFVTGVFMLIGQLVIFPAVIKEVGIATWSRAGCLIAVVASLTVPHAKALSWNEGTLFAVSATSSTLIKFGEGTVMIALTVGTTSVVPADQRGKLSGVYNTAESLGRFLGPATFAIMFAWSISASAPGWVDNRFVFYLCAVIMLGVTTLSWSTLTNENLMKPTEPGNGDTGGVAGIGTITKDEQKEVDFASSPRVNGREADIV